MIDTLRDLCVKQAARHIVEGRLKTAHRKLDVESSNLVMPKFQDELTIKPTKGGYSKCCQYIKNLLRVTKIMLSHSLFDENLIKMIYDQDLLDLQLWELKDWKIFHLEGDEAEEEEDSDEEEKSDEEEEEEADSDDQEEEEISNEAPDEAPDEEQEEDSDMEDEENSDEEEEEEPVRRKRDLIAILETILNPRSRQNLKSLLICGEDVEFLPGWVEKLATLLPSLSTLSLWFVDTERGIFESICNSFPNLTELEILHSKVTNVNGISKLANLTSLKFSHLAIERKEDIAEVFTLQQLRTLKIGGDPERNGYADNFMYYLQNYQNLPQLTFFDCSFCDISFLMIDTLVETHENLKTINILGTGFEIREQLRDKDRKDLKLWCLGSFGDCMFTLKSLLQSDVVLDEYIVGIRRRLVFLLENQYEEISQEELSECLKLMCDVMKACPMRSVDTAEVLELLCRDERASRFSFIERQHLIFTVIQDFHMLREHEKSNPYSLLARNEFIWEVLANDVIFHTSPENLDRICEDAAYIFHHSYWIRTVLPVGTMDILEKHLDKMSPDRRRAVCRNLKLTKTALNLLRHRMSQDEEETPHEVRSLVNILDKLYEFREETSERTVKIDKDCVEVLSASIVSNGEDLDLDLQTHIVRALGRILEFMSEEAKLSFLKDKEQFPAFVKMFYNQNTEQQKLTIFLFYNKFAHLKRTKKNKLLSSEDQDALLEDVEGGLDGFEETEDVFEGLRWCVKKCKNKITKEMCTWMIKEFGGEEEKKKSRKRRRN